VIVVIVGIVGAVVVDVSRVVDVVSSMVIDVSKFFVVSGNSDVEIVSCGLFFVLE